MTELDALRTEIDQLRYDGENVAEGLDILQRAFLAYLFAARDSNFAAREAALEILNENEDR